MATIAGSIKSLTNGSFSAKDENGNIRVLKVGDEIYENDTVYGDSGNSPSSQVEIQLSGNDIIVLSEGQKQLIDSSLIETAFGTEELFFTIDGIDLKADVNNSGEDVVSDLRDAEFTDDKKEVDEEAALANAGDADITEEETAAGEEIAEDGTDVQGIFQDRDGNVTNVVSDLRDAQFVSTTQTTLDNSSNTIIADLSVDDVVAYEDDGFLVFTVSLDRAVSGDVTFNYSTSPITATANGTDYTDVSGTVTIPAGSTSVTIRVPITDDYISDNGETININITDVEGNANVVKPDGIGTILDDTTPGSEPDVDTTKIVLVAVNAGETVADIPTDVNGALIIDNTNTTPEGGKLYYIAVAVDEDGKALTTQDGTVDVSYGETPDNGTTDDYTATNTTVTIGEVFTVDATDDYYAEGDEDFTVTISNPENTPYETVVVDADNNGVISTIIDNPANNVENPNDPEEPITGTPSEPTDPTDPSDTPSYGSEDTIYAKITSDDSAAEGDSLEHTVSLYTIDEDGNEVPFTVDAGETITVTLGYTPADTDGAIEGTTSPADYTGTTTVTFTSADGSSQTVSNPTIDDFYAEEDESYTATITQVVQENGTYENVAITTVVEDQSVTGTITDNESSTPTDPGTPSEPTDPTDPSDTPSYGEEDTVYAIITGDVSVNEGDKAGYTVSLQDKDGNPVTVSEDTEVTVIYTNGSTSSNDAAEDGDTEYLNNGTITVTIVAGESSVELDANTVDDYYAENDEDYTLTLENVDTDEFENVVVGDVDGNYKDVITTIIDNPANNVENPNDPEEPITGTPSEPTDPTDPSDTPSYGSEDTVYVQITQDASVIEGNALVHNIQLVDNEGNNVTIPDGETVTVTLTYETTTGTIGNEDFVNSSNEYAENSTITIILDSNGAYTITNTTLDDFIAEGEEDYTLTITEVVQSGAFENVVIGDVDGNNKDVTGEILDGVTLGIPTNTSVDEDNFDATDSSSTLTKTESLNITSPESDNNYELLFEGTPTFTSDDTSYTTLTSDGITIEYVTVGNTTTAYSGAGRTDDDRVFEITLDKNSAGGSDDSYTYTQYQNIDHPTVDSDDDIVLTLAYKITDQNGAVSEVQNFTVTVNDSLPTATDQTITLNEDSSQVIVISTESFENGEIEIDNNAGTIITLNTTDGTDSIDIYDVSGINVVGELTNNGDGTLTFTPTANYSGETAGFSYSEVTDTDGDTASANVAITVTPIADKADMNGTNTGLSEDTIVTTQVLEDNNNKTEVENSTIPYSATIGLILPTITDAIDLTATASGDDQAEKLGLITLSAEEGTQIDTDGDGVTDYTFGSSGEVTIYINSETDYHYLNDDGTTIESEADLSLSKTAFESISVVFANDDANNPEFTVSVDEYEVNDDNTIDTAVTKTTNTQDYEVDILAVTDDISLAWDDTTGTLGTNDGSTFTFTEVDEGGETIDLTSLLTKTSGLENDSDGDLDGSEERSYTISGIPEGTIVTLGGTSVIAGSDGTVTIAFPDNTVEDPSFTMTISEEYSGEISGTITLNVTDTDSDSTGTIDTKSASVDFTMTVNPVADDVTLNVAQAVGNEDTAIALNINALSNDNEDITGSTTTDEKETYNVTISDIPIGSIITYNGDPLTITGQSVSIEGFDNDAPLTITPPENSDEDFLLTVEAVSNDGGELSDPPVSLTLSVTVNDVADGVNEVELKKVDSSDDVNDDDSKNIYQVVTTEDTPASLADIYESITFYDNDSSESLSLIITGLAEGYEIEGATYLSGEGENRVWVVSKDSLDSVTVTTPDNYSGEVDLNIGYVTTEKAGDSLTQKDVSDLTPIKILVTPDAEDSTITNSMNINEDALTAIDFAITTSDDSESLQSITIDASSIGDDFTLYYKNSDGSFSEITSDTTYIDGDWENVYAQFDADLGASSDNTFNFEYTILDTTDGTITSGETITNETTSSGTYTINLSAVTDEISIDVDGTDNITAGTATITTDAGTNGKEVVTISTYGTFTVNVDISALASDSEDDTSKDTDGSETISYLQIEGVPDGINIVGGTYGVVNGANVWFVPVSDSLDADTIVKTLTFNVTDGLIGTVGDDYDITITAYNQDGVGTEITNDSTEITLIDNIGGDEPSTSGEVDATMTINNPGEVKEFNVTEDTTFTLNDIITINPDDNRTDEAYSITFKALENVTVTGDNLYSYVDENGDTNYVLNITSESDIETALENVVFTPTLNFNENNDNNTVVEVGSISMTAYVPGSSSITPAESTGTYTDVDVTPVTDTPTLSITTDNIDEDNTSETFDIEIGTVDDPDYSIINSVTMTLDDSSTINGGTITLSDGITTITVTKGDSFEIPADQLSGITFTPNENESGEANFSYSVTTQETGAINTETATGSLTINVNPVVDGLDLSVLAASGTEHTTVNGITSGDEYIELTNTGSLSTATFIDTDGSEEITQILLDDLPDGFIVYYSTDGGNTMTMATNAGDNGTDTILDGETVDNNTWSIPVSSTGTLPDIYVKAPENWSGTLSDINLKTTVTDGSEETIIDNTFTLTVDSVASDISINPTKVIGDAYEWSSVNLNANVVDTDGSETATITLTADADSLALDDAARFRINGTILDSTQAVFTDGTWTLTEISTADLADLEILYYDYTGVIDVTVKTIDGDDDSSITESSFDLSVTTSHNIDLSSETTDMDIIASEGNFNDNITGGSADDYIDAGAGSDTIDGGNGNDTIDAGAGADIITTDGNDTIDAGAGFDTLILDAGASINIDFTKLDNIEKIDLTNDSADTLNNLTLADVVDMTDSNNELKIISDDSEDSVSFKESDGWTKDANTVTEDGKTFDVYSNSDGIDSVQVKVEQPISDGVTS